MSNIFEKTMKFTNIVMNLAVTTIKEKYPNISEKELDETLSALVERYTKSPEMKVHLNNYLE